MKQNQIKSKGIVLRRIDLKEADQIVTVLTRDEGRVGILAKGSRRMKSKFSGKLELFSVVELNYFQGRELAYLNEVESQSLFEENTLDLHSRSLLFYMAESTQKLLAEAQPCQEVFELLLEALAHFDNQCGERVFYAYMVKLLTTLGFMQAWDESLEGGGKLDLNRTYYLCEREGRLKEDQFAGIKVSSTLIKWVNYMQKESFEQVSWVKPSYEEKVEVFRILKSMMSNLLNYPLKSEVFLNQTRVASPTGA